MPSALGPDLRDLLNELTTLRDDPLRFFVDLADRYGDLVRMPFGPKRFAFVVSGPEHVQHILQDQARRYSKDTATGLCGISCRAKRKAPCTPKPDIPEEKPLARS